MVKNNLNPQNKYKIVTTLLVFSFVAMVFCLYYLKDLTANINTTRKNIAETQRDNVLLDNAVRDRDRYITDISKIKNTLPSKYYEISFFTSQLETLAKKSNLAIQIDIDNKAVEEKDAYSSISYSLELNGSYSSISEYLSQMTKLPYHTIVDSLNMSIENGSLVCVVKIRLFIKK